MIPSESRKGKRQELEELLLRFFAYSDAYQNFLEEGSPVPERIYQNAPRPVSGRIQGPSSRRPYFRKDIFPNGFRKGGAHRTVPRVRFEAIAVGAALALKEQPNLIPVDVLTWLESDRFTEPDHLGWQ